jgi:hypothetical protein
LPAQFACSILPAQFCQLNFASTAEAEGSDELLVCKAAAKTVALLLWSRTEASQVRINSAKGGV